MMICNALLLSGMGCLLLALIIFAYYNYQRPQERGSFTITDEDGFDDTSSVHENYHEPQGNSLFRVIKANECCIILLLLVSVVIDIAVLFMQYTGVCDNLLI